MSLSKQSKAFSGRRLAPYSTKSSLIPNEIKEDIDDCIEHELVSANRYFAEQNPNISRLVKRAANMDSMRFLITLTERWNWHNDYFENMLEPALGSLIEERSVALSPWQISALRDAYATASLVDQATLVMSAAIKLHVEERLKDPKFARLSQDERLMLLTPPEKPFYVRYRREHLEYLLALRRCDEKTAHKLKTRLMREYHANDELIFRGRIKKIEPGTKVADQDLEDTIAKLADNRDYAVRHLYLTLERSDLKAVRDILAYDNGEEHLIAKSLVGISGFILRKRVLGYLKEVKYLKREGGIYDFSDEDIAKGLDTLIRYRREFMDKGICGEYTQTSGVTCSAVCLMQILERYGLVQSSRAVEDELYSRTRSRLIPGSHYSALSDIATEAGFESVLLHSEPGRFKNGGLFSDSTFRRLLQEYEDYLKPALDKGAQVLDGVAVNSGTVREYLSQNYLVCVAGQVAGSLHSVLATGYTADSVIVHDPLSGAVQHMKDRGLDWFMQTLVGSWMLAVRRPAGAVDGLTRAIPAFKRQAEACLKPEGRWEA